MNSVQGDTITSELHLWTPPVSLCCKLIFHQGGGGFLTGKDFHGKRTVLVVAAATAAPRPQHKCHGGSFS